jgi:hypothetical protein
LKQLLRVPCTSFIAVVYVCATRMDHQLKKNSHLVGGQGILRQQRETAIAHSTSQRPRLPHEPSGRRNRTLSNPQPRTSPPPSQTSSQYPSPACAPITALAYATTSHAPKLLHPSDKHFSSGVFLDGSVSSTVPSRGKSSKCFTTEGKNPLGARSRRPFQTCPKARLRTTRCAAMCVYQVGFV